MESTDGINTYYLIKLSPGFLVALGCAQVVAGCKDMAGIDAHPKSVPPAGIRKNLGKMLKAVTHRRSLASHDLEEDFCGAPERC